MSEIHRKSAELTLPQLMVLHKAEVVKLQLGFMLARGEGTTQDGTNHLLLTMSTEQIWDALGHTAGPIDPGSFDELHRLIDRD